MDVVEGSYIEKLKQYLEKHPHQEFKAQKEDGVWKLTVKQTRVLESMSHTIRAATFGEAIKLLVKVLEND